MARIILNETSYFGFGCRANLVPELKGRGLKRVLVVTDAPLVKFGVAKKVTDCLDQGGIVYTVFSDVKANPTVTNVKNCLKALKGMKAQALVAIGGGSVMDTAKGAGITAANPAFKDVVSLEGCAATAKPSLPIFALPTTAGTASEVTINYVIIDEKKQKKMVCVDPHDIPVCAIIDAELMASMPASLKAATGMDALTHAIEGYITKGSWPMTNMFELEAIRMIAKWLPLAVEQPKNKEALEGMALAQYIAGMGFSNAGLGIVHSLAHPLGAVYNIPHGVANALLLPTIMDYNKSAALAKFADIARAMGVKNVEKMTPAKAADAAVAAVQKLALRVKIPQRLAPLGVKEADFQKLATDALHDVCTGGNPRKTSIKDIIALYKKVY